jgi:DNA-binding transcriptional MerR regulator
MKIGQFIEAVQTTKDTVRYYEELALIQPTWEHNRRIYGEKEVADFLVIKEMQALGLALKEIQLLFTLKRNNGCGNNELIEQTRHKLEEKREELRREAEAIKQRQEQLTEIIDALAVI